MQKLQKLNVQFGAGGTSGNEAGWTVPIRHVRAAEPLGQQVCKTNNRSKKLNRNCCGASRRRTGRRWENFMTRPQRRFFQPPSEFLETRTKRKKLCRMYLCKSGTEPRLLTAPWEQRSIGRYALRGTDQSIGCARVNGAVVFC